MSGKRKMKTGTPKMHCSDALIWSENQLLTGIIAKMHFKLQISPARIANFVGTSKNPPFKFQLNKRITCAWENRISWALHEHRHTHTHSLAWTKFGAIIISYIRTYITIDGICWNAKWMHEWAELPKMWKYLQDKTESSIMSCELFFAIISIGKSSIKRHMVRCLVFSMTEQCTMLS